MRFYGIGLLAMLLLATEATSQPRTVESAGVSGESAELRRQLQIVENLIAEKQFANVRQQLLAILTEDVQELVYAGNGRYISATSAATALLAQLPEAELRAARRGWDEAASGLLQRWKLTQEPAALERLIRRYPLSSHTRAARVLLGDCYFERGDFHRAERKFLAASDTELRDAMESSWSGPELKGRAVLACIKQGDPDRARMAIQEFSEHFPEARGRLAGREGLLAELLRQEYPSVFYQQSPAGSCDDWQTLGGNAARTGHVAGSLAALSLRPVFTVNISEVDGNRLTHHTSRFPFFASVMNSDSIVTSSPSTAVHIDAATSTGRSLQRQRSTTSEQSNVPFLLGQRLILRNGDVNDSREGLPWILEIDLTGKDESNRNSRYAAPFADRGGTWVGDPLATERALLAVASRIDGGRQVHSICCVDRETGRQVWQRDVCELAATAESDQSEPSLTLADSSIVYLSHRGVIAVVSLDTGEPRWSVRYERSSLQTRSRSVATPAIYSDGRVLCAPRDAERLFAFDLENGAILWQSGSVQVDHLIGVTGRRLVAAIERPQRGLRAYCVRTGSTEPPSGWQQHDDPMLSTFGRGVIVGNLIAWPTHSGMYLIREFDGLPARPLIPGLNGNLAFANGRLVAANASTVAVYESWDLRNRRQSPQHENLARSLLNTLPLNAMLVEGR